MATRDSARIKNFLDILILTQLVDHPMGGCSLITCVHKKFGILVSSGTIYSTLYSLEGNGLVKATFDGRARVYSITKKKVQMKCRTSRRRMARS